MSINGYDKYEKFKEWFKKSRFIFYDTEDDLKTMSDPVFYEFEAEEQLKQKENEIKETISNIVMRTPITDNIIDKIYDELKEKDMIK